MDDEKILFTELEATIIKFKKLRDKTTIGIKEYYFGDHTHDTPSQLRS